jgi:hypothetical protein
MGLSSSKTKTTSNTSQNTNQTENATTTPVTPDWLTQAAQDYVGRIGSFGDMDPNNFVAPSSPLQNMAWQNAGSLGDWRGQAATASQLALGAGQGGANLAGAGAMGRFAALGLQPAAQMSGGGAQMQGSALGGSAQSAANALGGDKTMPAHSSNMPRPPADQSAPGNAFSGSAQQPRQQGPAFTYQAPNVQNFAAPTAYGASQTSLGNAPQAGGQGYAAPQLGHANLVGGQGYSAPQLGQAGGYAAARTGAPIGAETRSYNPALATPAGIAPTADAFASSAGPSSLLDNLGAYQNPYTDRVVRTALADYDDNAARQRAALEAQGARTGAFGGSRFGIAEGQLGGDLARGRATLEAGLLDQGFNTAAGLSQYDATNRQQAALFNAQNQTGVTQGNAAAANNRALAQAGMVQQANLAGQDAMNQSSQFGAAAYNTSQGQYADAANRAALDYAGRADSASQFGIANQQQRDLAQAGYADNAARYGADSSMQAALANQAQLGQYGLAQAGLSADAAKYGAEAGNQASLANQGLAGQYGLARFGADTQNAQNYAQARNASSLADYQGRVGNAQLQAQLAAQAGQYDAGANNQMSQFNASQQDAALNRQLSAAGMLGGLANDYGAGTRADLGTMAQLGDQQRQVEQAYAMAGPAQLQLMGQLSGMTPYDILVGRQVNGNTTGSSSGTGTQTVTQSPSLFDMLMQAGNSAARAYAAGTGG